MENKEVHQTDFLLHDLIVPTIGEQYNEDDHYGVERPAQDCWNDMDRFETCNYFED